MNATVPILEPCDASDAALLDAVGVLLALGALCSYAPQVLAVLRAQSADGLSFHSLMLHAITNSCTFMGVVVASFRRIQCACAAAETAVSLCFSAVLPLVQLSTSVLGIHVLWTVAVAAEHLQQGNSAAYRRHWQELRIYACLQWCAVGGLLLWMLLSGQQLQQALSLTTLLVNIVASAANAAMWLPQIYTTWHTSQRGTLSIATLLMQCFGSCVAGTFLVLKHMPAAIVVPFGINVVSLATLCALWVRLWRRDSSVERLAV